jgi:DNA-binding transcriptional LysR family regulator
MKVNLGDLAAFVAVARAQGFRDAARATSSSASGLSDAVRRLESKLGVRLLNRSTRSVVPTEAGASLLARLDPVLSEVDSALDVINGFRDTPTGTLRLNVPVSAARLVLPSILPRFFAAYPEIRVEVIAEESFVDMLAAGCDAGIRYEERLEQDMLAVPIGPRIQRMAAAASPAYLARHGCPAQPHELLNHTCMRARFASGALVRWQFTRDGETITIDPSGPLLVQVGGAIDLAVEVALAGTGIVYLFEDWLRPYMDRGLLDPVLEPWWPRFSGPFLYYSGRKLLPAPLRAFVDFIRHDAVQVKAPP